LSYFSSTKEHFRLKSSDMFNQDESHERGAILIQAMAVVAAVGAISLVIINTVGELSKNSRFTGHELAKSRATQSLLRALGSSGGCTNTFSSATGTLTSPSDVLTANGHVRDKDNEVRYEHCELGGIANCAAGVSYGSYIANGDLRLASSQITNFNSVTEKATMIFSFYDKDNPNPAAGDRKRVVRMELNVRVDGSGNFVSCNFGGDNDLESICDLFSGTLEGTVPQEFCKSLFIHKRSAEVENTTHAIKARDDLQVTGELNVSGALVLGSTAGSVDNPGSGRLSGPSEVDVAGYASVLNHFNVGFSTPAAYRSSNKPGAGQIDHSLWMGTSGTRPAMSPGDVVIGTGGEFKVLDQIELTGFLRTTNMSSRRTEAVTVDWVKQQVAEAVAGTGNLTDVWNEIATVAAGTESNAEESLRQDFCASIEVLNNFSDGSSSLDTSPVTSCLADIKVMMNNCDTNGNCSNVFANRVCIGTGAAEVCYNTKPQWRYAGGCENTIVQNVSHELSPGVFDNYNRFLCNPNKPWLIYNSANNRCCTIRLGP